MRKKAAIVLLLGLAVGMPVFSQVMRPSDLSYPPLTYNPPDPLLLRTVYNNGLKAYFAEDRSLPAVTIVAQIQYGSLFDPQEKAGLAQLMQGTLIKGGTLTRHGSLIEERIDFLGATLNFTIGERISTLTLSLMSKDLIEGLAIFFDVLMHPEFREESLGIARGRAIEELRQVNDSPRPLVEREFARLLYGEHPITFQPVRQSVESVSGHDLKAAHARYFLPNNVILAVSGDFDRKAIKSQIGRLTASWKKQRLSLPPMSGRFPECRPGLYYVQKEISQGYVNMGHLGIEETNPDYFAVQVMNFILGGGSFTSRITSKVRSDEGLAYNTGSRFAYRWGFPGVFAGYVQTKSVTVGYAVDLIRREFERIRVEPVADDELATAKNYFLESFADFFATPQTTVRNFAALDLQGRPLDYYRTYRDQVKRITKESVLEAARTYLHPDKTVILIVGNWSACNVTSEKFPFTLEKFGPVQPVFLIDRFGDRQGTKP